MIKLALLLLTVLPVFVRAEMAVNCVQETDPAYVEKTIKEWTTSQLVPGVEIKDQTEGAARARTALERGLDAFSLIAVNHIFDSFIGH